MSAAPLLKDLYQNITPHYAADWKVIGTLLGLPSGELKAIEAGYPTNVKWCCNKMLERWLEMDPTASWDKMCRVIESPAVSHSALNKGGYLCVYCIAINMWYKLMKICMHGYIKVVESIFLLMNPLIFGLYRS